LNCSDEIYHIFEIDPDKFSASYEAFLDAIHPDDREMVNTAYTNSLKTREPYRIEHRLRMKDGTVKYVEERCETTFGLSGNPIKSVGTVQDITSQKIQERAMQEQRQLLRNVIDTTPDLIFYKDYKHQNGCYLGCNRAFEIFTGMEEADLLGKNDLEIFGDEIGSFFRGKDREVLRQGESIANEEWVTYPDGHEVLLQTMKTPLFDRFGDVWGIVGTSRDITERWMTEQKIKEQQEKIKHQARYDALTDLPNRNLFDEELHNAIHRPQQEREFFALFFIDLDNFKYVNDTYGHAIGDEVLVVVATRLRHIFRQDDTIARFGGDEFVVLVKSLDKAEYTSQLAQKILAVFEEPIRIGGQSFEITASIGISLYPQDALDVQTLIEQADQAMYSAKKNGRNTYRFYTS
jgi:diguanylate cyclase (GGDEF)-like protein/PAS domain S-box-containing protein